MVIINEYIINVRPTLWSMNINSNNCSLLIQLNCVEIRLMIDTLGRLLVDKKVQEPKEEHVKEEERVKVKNESDSVEEEKQHHEQTEQHGDETNSTSEQFTKDEKTLEEYILKISDKADKKIKETL